MRIAVILSAWVLSFSTSYAQNDTFEQFRQNSSQKFENFNNDRQRKFDEFRRQRNAEFAEFVRERWAAFEVLKGRIMPKEKEVPPVVIDDDQFLFPQPKPLPFDEVVTIKVPEPQPIPIDPIEELPKDDPVVKDETCHEFTFYGTSAQVRLDKTKLFRLANIKEATIADAWVKLSEPVYANLIYDCLQIRQDYSLCDWAYLQMLAKMAESVCREGTSEATLLMAYVYCQSGYKMRLANSDGRLCMLYASKHGIYEKGYFELDGEQFYPYGETGATISICEASFPKEQSMSLLIPQAPEFAWQGSGERTLKSERYPSLTVKTMCNKNMIDFYSSYPSSEINGNVMTRWAMYANTPLEEGVRKELYPALRSHIAGLSKQEAVERLLNWVQTAFVYEYDDKVWGGDRAFFPEESLYYPYCDCEDRSILFTRLVRDLLGLKCILVYYPGHLASAVCFEGETVNGDYIQLNGRRYVVCDPTYINAPLGRTMPGMDNAEAKVILLE